MNVARERGKRSRMRIPTNGSRISAMMTAVMPVIKMTRAQ